MTSLPELTNTNRTFAGQWIIGVVVKPYEIADPICMRVTTDNNVVVYLMFVQGLKSSITIRLISIPSIIVQGVDITACSGFVDSGENYIISMHSPL